MERVDALTGVDAAARDRLWFLAYAHRLTGVERFCRVPDGSRQENSAEHSWHVGLCALVLAPAHAPEVDLGRVLRMLAIHDVVEVEIGDEPFYNKARRASVAEAERAAAKRIFEGLPEGEGLLRLWREFEAASSADARFARAVDRLQPILLHWIGGGRLWRSHAMRRSQLDEIVDVVERLWPRLAPLARAVVDDAARRGDFAGDAPERVTPAPGRSPH